LTLQRSNTSRCFPLVQSDTELARVVYEGQQDSLKVENIEDINQELDGGLNTQEEFILESALIVEQPKPDLNEMVKHLLRMRDEEWKTTSNFWP
jgi:hypothetical protein